MNMLRITGAVIALLPATGLLAQSDCEPYFGKLLINEIMAGNDNTAADPNGEFDDWVEIYNAHSEPINLQGYFLSDDHGERTKFQFPDLTLAAGGTAIIWCDNQPEQEGLHAPFSLSGSGEEVGLYNPDTTSVDYLRYGAIPDDISVGRYPNGSGPFKVLIPTFDAVNTNSVDVGLVINEYQAINETTADDQWGGYEDWIELYNNSTQAIDLSGYFLSDRIGEPTQYTFPDTSIGPGQYLIVWCDMGLFEPGLHAIFQMGSDGDDILLSNADTLTIDYVRFGLQIPDDSEGRFPNGTGSIDCLIPSFSASNGGVVSVDDTFAKRPWLAYPNPAHDRLHLTGLQPGTEVRIHDLSGRLLSQHTAFQSGMSLQLTSLKPGLYLLTAGGESQTFVVR